MFFYRIMCFDGGGIKGSLTVNLLKRLEDYRTYLFDKTCLYAGVSTGSIIAVALAAGMNIDKLIELYSEENVHYIFSPKYSAVTRPKYNNKRLKEVLTAVLGTRTLNSLPGKVVIPAFKVKGDLNYKSWQPFFFSNLSDSNSGDIKIIDAVLASCAAPVYFSSYKGFVDGGIINNNPGIATITHAFSHVNKNRIIMLSLGTGFNKNYLKGDCEYWGALQWIFNKNPSFPLFTLMFDGSLKTDTCLCKKLLGNRYHRLNPEIDRQIGIDNYRDIPFLERHAETINLTDSFKWLSKYW